MESKCVKTDRSFVLFALPRNAVSFSSSVHCWVENGVSWSGLITVGSVVLLYSVWIRSSEAFLFHDWHTEVCFTGRANCSAFCMPEKQTKPPRLAALSSLFLLPPSFCSVSLVTIPWCLMCPWPSLLSTSDKPCFSCTASSSWSPSQIEKCIFRSDL